MPKASVGNKKKQTSTAKTKTAKQSTLSITTETRHNLPNVWRLSGRCAEIVYRYRWTIAGILLIYGVTNFVLVQGLSNGLNVSSLKSQVDGLFHGQFNQLSSGLTVYALMLTSFGSSSTSSSSGGFGLQLVLGILASLAIIWAIRNALNNTKFRLRDAYYKGMYPLIPFTAVLLIIGLELLPMVAGISIYVIAINNSIAITTLEKLGFILLMLLLSSVTLYWISSSIFALYIATLPDMTPVKALRSAKKLVKKRRWAVLIRLLYLPLALLIVSCVIMLPAIIFIASVAQWVFTLLSLILLALAHCYLYNLYRELLE